MNFVQLILTVCTLVEPASCDERKLMFEAQTASLQGCMMQAMPFIAQWSGEHPSLRVTSWRCARPGAGGQPI